VLDPPTDAIVTEPPRETADPFIVIVEFDNLALEMEPANIVSVTTPDPITVVRATLADPLNPVAPAVTLPANEKVLVFCKVVADTANPVLLPVPPYNTGIGFPVQFDPAGIVVATIVATSTTLPVPLNATVGLVTSPVTEKFLDVTRLVAVVALPVRAPTNVVEVTEVKPAKVVELAPNEIEVEPIVTAELARLALLIPAVPERLALTNPEIVLEPAAIVLFVSVSALAKVANVPEVGKVTEVVPLAVNVTANAPLVVKFPPRVIVLPLLATPVPPYRPAITEPFHVPEVIVPMLTLPLLNNVSNAPPLAEEICASGVAVPLVAPK
jgi:hypothetical protein